jgi:hypothetical protein
MCTSGVEVGWVGVVYDCCRAESEGRGQLEEHKGASRVLGLVDLGTCLGGGLARVKPVGGRKALFLVVRVGINLDRSERVERDRGLFALLKTL